MKRSFVFALLALAGWALPLQAQRETERFIPIGRSPGVSSVSSAIGTLESVDTAAGIMRVATDRGTVTIRFRADVDIWIDRSAQRQTALVGRYDDLVPGRRVEVKFMDPERRDIADWIKVAAPPGARDAPLTSRTPPSDRE